jgi:hydrogenase nickel incorporation protein HypB
MIFENVGNLVCLTYWNLGEQKHIYFSSTAKGHGKPVKYLDIFVSGDAVILNKIDLIDLVGFKRQFFHDSLHALNRMREGLTAWTEWLLNARNTVRPVRLASMDKPVQ